MVLTVDIGNSNITLGGFDSDELCFVAHIASDPSATSDDYAARILGVLGLYKVDLELIDGAIIASVVPQLDSVIKKAVKFLIGVEPLTVGPGIKTGISIRCDNPVSVGADLICASVAAHFIYGSPSLIIDMGTATKMTVVNKSGAFIGTSIIPGIMMGLRALSTETAQLPRVGLDAPSSVIAKNTADCMKSGVIFGNASMVDGMIERIENEMKESLNVLITGGYASAVLPYCKRNMTYDEHLVIRGLNIIYKKNR